VAIKQQHLTFICLFISYPGYLLFLKQIKTASKQSELIRNRSIVTHIMWLWNSCVTECFFCIFLVIHQAWGPQRGMLTLVLHQIRIVRIDILIRYTVLRAYSYWLQQPDESGMNSTYAKSQWVTSKWSHLFTKSHHSIVPII